MPEQGSTWVNKMGPKGPQGKKVQQDMTRMIQAIYEYILIKYKIKLREEKI